jgi:hypothetical protein
MAVPILLTGVGPSLALPGSHFDRAQQPASAAPAGADKVETLLRRIDYGVYA